MRIAYSKLSFHKIHDDEAAAILAGESGGGKWREKSNFSLNPFNVLIRKKLWANSNGNSAYLDGTSTNLFVESPAAKAFTEARAEEKEKQRKSNIPKF